MEKLIKEVADLLFGVWCFLNILIVVQLAIYIPLKMITKKMRWWSPSKDPFASLIMFVILTWSVIIISKIGNLIYNYFI
jgi:hypothetical protein